MRPLLLYARRRARALREEALWRFYVAEAVRLAPSGKCLDKRFSDVLAADERMARRGPAPDGDAIARSVIARAGLEVIG